MKIAILWSRFGPYHLARLRSAAQAAAGVGGHVWGIEVTTTDAIYAWDAVESTDDFERVSLFSDRPYEALTAGEIASAVRAALTRIGPDVVAVNGWSVVEARAALAWCKERRRGIAVVMSESKEDDSPRTWWKEMIKSRIVRRFDAALVGGRIQADYLVKLGLPRENIRLGYDVVDNDYFSRGAADARTDRRRIAAELGLPERFFFVCTRFIERKNVDGLLHAYAVYRAERGQKAWGLVVAGGGVERETYRRIERDLGLGDVIWPGFVQYDRLCLYYGLASAFVHPAKAEAWGLVVNEAMASGLPVLVSRTVGAGYELVEEGVNGWRFDPASPEEMGGALVRMAALAEAERVAMGEASKVIVARWTPNVFGSRLLEAIGSVTSVHSRERKRFTQRA